eukprot:TRINITY_DN3251_c0_g1_i1.p1 TRINITY_DN3251_c0_g1~~TRINITY_DN3251_c0_g1_i1.p1  ORF type:complete len:492 (-),score=87.75 TRINITY_DN3251_c0_g1_i1:80-1516(-)
MASMKHAESQVTMGLVGGPEVTDRNHLVYIVFVVLGVGLLLPWNVVITALDYWTEIYPETWFVFGLSSAYNAVSLPMLAVTIWLGPKMTLSPRIIWPFAIDAVALALIPVVTYYSVDPAGEKDFLIPTHISIFLSLAIVGVLGVATAVLFGSVLGYAALFPPKYTTAVMTGNGVAGVIAGALRILTKFEFAGDASGLKWSGMAFFATGFVIMSLCLVTYLWSKTLEYTHYILLKADADREKKRVMEASGRVRRSHANETSVVSLMADGYNENESLLGRQEAVNHHPEDMTISVIGGRSGRTSSSFGVLCKIWIECFEVFYVFFVTLTFFPGVTSLIPSNTGNSSYDKEWFPILMVGTFQLFDLVGRTIVNWVTLPRSSVWVLVILRTGLVALFFFSIRPIFFTNIEFSGPYLPYIFMAVFALTNGFSGTLAMMYGPSRVAPEDLETAGIMMSFFLNLGIVAGVVAAIGVMFVVSPSTG